MDLFFKQNGTWEPENHQLYDTIFPEKITEPPHRTPSSPHIFREECVACVVIIAGSPISPRGRPFSPKISVKGRRPK